MNYKQLLIDTDNDVENVDFNQCNADQKLFYKEIYDWTKKKLDNHSEQVKPIYLILSGRAGCGKTFAVKCVKKFIKDENCPSGFLKLAAPTGAAAFLIKGTTLHSLFKLPVNISFQTELPFLQGTQLQQLQHTFQNTEIVIIDEMSMVGQYMLYQISRRLQEAKPNNGTVDFGGVSIVLMGDFAQLPPVTDLPVFESTAKSKYQIIGGKLYHDNFKTSFTLTMSMRQRGSDQETFRKIIGWPSKW